MKIVVFLNAVGLGGTEKAAATWANALLDRGHAVHLLALEGGPGLVRFADGIPFHEASGSAELAACLRAIRPEIMHAHLFGWPGPADILGEVLAGLDFRLPVLETNVFGLLNNPAEDAWVTARAFISWTSGVQAAQRHGVPLDERFFRRATVITYPLAPQEPAAPEAIAAFRKAHGVQDHEILFGKLGRPDMNKWSDLVLKGFLRARQSDRRLKFLVREAPPEVLAANRALIDQGVLIPLTMTSDEGALRQMMSSVDVLLHTSKIGESFGYGIAEAMALGKPVITNCTPRADQAQVELVEDGVCGFLASSPRSVCRAITRLAGDADLRDRFGAQAVTRIRRIADLETSVERLETMLQAVVAGRENPFLDADVRTAGQARRHLRKHRFGHDPFDVARLWVIATTFGLLNKLRARLRAAGLWKRGR